MGSHEHRCPCGDMYGQTGMDSHIVTTGLGTGLPVLRVAHIFATQTRNFKNLDELNVRPSAGLHSLVGSERPLLNELALTVL